MIRRYIKRAPSIRFSIGKKRIGATPSESWIGIEIDSIEPIPDYVAAERGLVPADGMSEAELAAKGVTSWEVVSLGRTTS